MDKLLEKAKKFLDTNTNCNEVELTDSKGNRVRLVRFTPSPTITYVYPYQWNPYPSFTPNY